jgi:two-component system phosphate regulon response regulator OmpR
MENSKKNILVVDDDIKINKLVSQYLKEQGLAIHSAHNGKDLDKILDKNHIDLIILDLMLPDESGLDICKRLRVNKINIPIIMLTAKGDEVDRILGLEMGADDYLPKPFNPRELLARISAILRRQITNENTSIKQTDVTKFGLFEFNNFERVLKKNNVPIDLTSGEFDLVKVFIENANQPLSREKIMQLVRGKELEVFDRSIDVQISRIRKLIEDDPNNPIYLKTKWGYGYVFEIPSK